ncbi:1-(5-phosphoribosyl)-5-[(5-phosphoribosylamino)methylideneamino]imidazole-4-carboxamide isomerase [Candidatus Poribacteria bacterium]|nr:1-(5-phosphoribosyl)-5-[(5-phosphoribosylamino)methylideneamino]imidazole-4-carboxamide isomerase [Candidatus Poribacteria bacterium]
MLIIPAIDLRGGKCVRLIQGKADAETIFSDDPVTMAKNWESKGAQFLHVVDLDGAFEGKPKNLEIIKQIADAIEIPIEMGGGIRDQKTIETVFKAGVYRVILGTSALKDPAFAGAMCEKYGGRIAVGIDARDGLVAIHGWTELEKKKAIEFATEMEKAGVRTIIYTDIKRDGMLTGPNIEALRKMAQVLQSAELIASGGVSSIEDIKSLKTLESLGVTGVIIGKALYTGNINLEEAISV